MKKFFFFLILTGSAFYLILLGQFNALPANMRKCVFHEIKRDGITSLHGIKRDGITSLHAIHVILLVYKTVSTETSNLIYPI